MNVTSALMMVSVVDILCMHATEIRYIVWLTFFHILVRQPTT